jgi:site-specific recombinase XerD
MKKIKTTIVNSITYSKLKKQFLFFKKAQGLAERTLKDYNNTFNKFEKHYGEDVIDIEKMKIALFEMFEPLSTGAPATFNVPFSNLMCFFNWCVCNEYLEKNPLNITGLKKKKDVGKARAIPEDIICKLFNVIDISTYIGFRDYLILMITLDK